jgi:hypothetical protein
MLPFTDPKKNTDTENPVLPGGKGQYHDIDADLIPDDAGQETDPEIIPDEDPFENPPPDEEPEPGEGP